MIQVHPVASQMKKKKPNSNDFFFFFVDIHFSFKNILITRPFSDLKIVGEFTED